MAQVNNASIEFSERIDEIRGQMIKLFEQECMKNNVAIEKKVKKIKVKKDDNTDLNILKGRINKMMYKNELKKKGGDVKNQNEGNSENKFLDSNDDIFNIVNDESDYLDWKKIPKGEKIELIKKYFEERNEIPDKIRDEIIELIENNKLTTKKEITYDKINRKIINIPLIKNINNEYILKLNEKKINIKKRNMNNINKLFK